MQAVPNLLGPLESELQRERASALGRAGVELEKAMAAWQAARADGGDVEGTRREAQKRLWYLVVQREALGLNRHRELYEIYGIPRAWWL